MNITKEHKDLLLKDISARLPYGVKFESENAERVYFIDTSDDEIYINGTNIEDAKPYLFPLSSMTEEQKKELYTNLTELELKAINDEIEHSVVTAFEIDFYHKHHIDYRGLINKGLAIDATNKNIY